MCRGVVMGGLCALCAVGHGSDIWSQEPNSDAGGEDAAPDFAMVELLSLGGMPADDVASFGRIVGVAEDDVLRIYVLDRLYGEVAVFDSLGKFERVIGRRGWGPGEFQDPVLLALVSDSLLVIRDDRKGVYSALSLAGELMHRWETGSLSGFLRDRIAADQQGFLYDSRRTYRDSSIAPYVVRFDAAEPHHSIDTLPLPHYHRPTVRVTGAARGYAAYVSQPLSSDLHWTVLPNGDVVVCRPDRNELIIHRRFDRRPDTIGGIGSTIRPSAATAARALERRREEVAQRARTARASARDAVRRVRLPPYLPIISGVFADRRGYIWIRVTDGPEWSSAFQVRDGDGRLVATVSLPSGVDWQRAGVYFGVRRSYVWGETPDGWPYLRVFRIGATPR